MKRVLCFLLALLLLPLAALAEEPNEIDAAFDKIFSRYETTGGVVVVARDGEIVYQRNYGYAHKKSGEPVTDETYFRIASVSKLVSAIHVMQLVEQGLLDLDADISDYFGYPIRNLKYPDTPITLRQLMTHTSSIDSSGGYANAPGASVKELLSQEARRKKNYLTHQPGSKYAYSNFGAGLMGSLMEIATGKNLNDSITESLYAPLGIDAAYAPVLLKKPEKITYQYSEDGKVATSREALLAREWDPLVDPEHHYRSVAGRVFIRGYDLCRLGMVLCEGGTLDGQTLLAPETIAAMQEYQKGKPGVTGHSPYGLCVYLESKLLKDRTVYGL
ncbi:MAG: serine hydrolase [Clostridia bacterium]|nr:serine hydrolase [Clostridia bacterium]